MFGVEDLTLGKILWTVVSGLVQGVAKGVAEPVFKEKYLEFIKYQGKFVNHDLEKALRNSFLLAQRSIVSECRQELVASSRYVYRGSSRIGTLEHYDDIRLLEKKLSQIQQELNQVKELKENTTPISSLSDVGFLLTQTESLAQKYIKEQLLAEALQDIDLPYYRDKLENSLLERISAYFIFEIKNNQAVRDVLQTQLQIETYLRIDDLEKSLQNLAQEIPQLVEKLNNLEQVNQDRQFNSRPIIQIKIPVDNLSPDNLQNIITLIQQLSEDTTLEFITSKKGSIILFFESSQAGLDRLQRLFQSGELAARLGVPVEFVESISQDAQVVDIEASDIFSNLRQWFNNLFTGDWLEPQLIPAREIREIPSTEISIQRGKVIALSEGVSVALIIKITQESDEILGVIIFVKPIRDVLHLPAGLQVILIDESGETIFENISRDTTDAIEQEFAVAPQEKFSVILKMGNIQVIENIVS
ncbi:DUF1822 family protein [Nostoc sp. TCL26-01]|uniref:DUF1822 family protein n=1 Tax=Nostoc sp. TCL26-01 TaxID=2576904 RepID=UPI0015BE8E9D|nr:DUF1822 family protein [Nostoc sp. TCL26-01]QLE54194.1 DUF1822 family protein [Nostoc sp. TCL26-01]